MKSKTIYVWSGVQIVIGVLLLFGTAYMAISVLPNVKSSVRQTSKTFAETAYALKGIKETYCESSEILFSLTESLKDLPDELETISRNVTGMGRNFKFDIPILEKLNWVGVSMCSIGEKIDCVAEAIREQRDKIGEYQKTYHSQSCDALNDAVQTVDDIAKHVGDDRAFDVYCGYICLLGGVVSLLFITNGVVLCLFAQS